MVHQVQNADVRVQTEPPSYMPQHAQPWELALVLFGLPGAAASAAATCALLVFSQSVDPMVAIGGAGTLVGLYLTGVLFLWMGAANEQK